MNTVVEVEVEVEVEVDVEVIVFFFDFFDSLTLFLFNICSSTFDCLIYFRFFLSFCRVSANGIGENSLTNTVAIWICCYIHDNQWSLQLSVSCVPETSGYARHGITHRYHPYETVPASGD